MQNGFTAFLRQRTPPTKHPQSHIHLRRRRGQRRRRWGWWWWWWWWWWRRMYDLGHHAIIITAVLCSAHSW